MSNEKIDITREYESKAQKTEQKTTDTSSTTNKETKETTSAPVEQPKVGQTFNPMTTYTFEESSKLICEYYNTVFPQLECIMPLQIVDGGVVDFVDREKDQLVANARVRFTNSSQVANGSLFVEAKFANLAFVRQKHIIKMQLVESI